MVQTLKETRITAEAFLKMGSNGRGYELIDGELVEKRTSMKTSLIKSELAYILGSYINNTSSSWIFSGELGYQIFSTSDMIRKADISVILKSRLPEAEYEDEGFCTTPPNFVVEVASPNDLAYDINAKTEAWLNAGVDLVWNIYPNNRTIIVHTKEADRVVRATETIIGDPVLPGFSLNVAELFKR